MIYNINYNRIESGSIKRPLKFGGNMKKSVKVLAAFACLSVFLFNSCSEKKVTLKMWESDGPERQFMEWAAAKYKKSHPNIQIVYEPVGSPDARAKIELDGPAGVGADVFVAPHDHVGALVAGGHVLPVEDTSFINDFVDAAKVAGTYDGKLYGYNPYSAFLGSPYSADGWGCYYTVIGRCISKIVDGNRHKVLNLHRASLSRLVSFIDDGTPVIIWATQGMSKPERSQTWKLVGTDKSFTWVKPNHCLLLVGYDDTGYYFNDPLTHKNCRYPAKIVEKRYMAMGRQALAIVNK